MVACSSKRAFEHEGDRREREGGMKKGKNEEDKSKKVQKFL